MKTKAATTAYGNKTTEGVLSKGEVFVPVTGGIKVLEPGRLYHFRLVATNASGTTFGEDLSFSTVSIKWLATFPTLVVENSGQLEAVTCFTGGETACIAVGQAKAEGHEPAKMVIERHSSTEWFAAEFTRFGVLQGVSCLSEFCVAVGYTGEKAASKALIAGGNGFTWTSQELHEPTGALHSRLTSVSCSKANRCTAVGEYETSVHGHSTFAEQWNGVEWTSQVTVNPSEVKEIYPTGVSCWEGGAQCIMVGYYENAAGKKLPFAEHLSGTTWSLQTTINPSESTATTVSGVSCPESSPQYCAMVGSYVKGSGATVTLAEHWTKAGGWSVQSSANPGSQFSSLRGVSCQGNLENKAATCMAVGTFELLGRKFALPEYWNGGTSSWEALSTGSALEEVEGPSNLAGVSCRSSTECTAVGGAERRGINQLERMFALSGS